MQKLLLGTLATALLMRAALATEHKDSDVHSSAGLGHYILHGLGQTPTPTSASPDSHGPPWTVSVPSANIEWSSDFNSDYMSHARSCWNVYTSWYASWYASSFTGKTTITDSTTCVTYTTSSTIWPTSSLSTYTLCDGTPRAHYSPSTTVFATTLTEVFSNIPTTTSPVVPTPECQPNQDDCAVLYYGTNISDFSGDSFPYVRRLGACGYPLDASFPCLIQGGPVKLLYFPVTTTGGGLCGPNGTTVMPTTPPEPVTTLGSTLYPDSAYISFHTLYAAYRAFNAPGGAAAQIGPNFSDTIIGFKTKEISTNCYATWWNQTATSLPGFGPGTQLNFAELKSPVSAKAYHCQDQCLPYSVMYVNGEYSTRTISPNPCETIFDNFNPLLAVPTRLRGMVPEWKQCQFWSPRQANVIFDPPQALTKAPSEAKPTPPPGHGPGHKHPRPSPSPKPPGIPEPTQTPTALPDDLPSSSATAEQETSPQTQEDVTLPNHPTASSEQDSAAETSHSQQSEADTALTQTTIVVDDQTITASYPPDATHIAVVGDQTLSAGGPAATIDDHTISLAATGLIALDTSSSSPSTVDSSSPSQTQTHTSSSSQTPTTSPTKSTIPQTNQSPRIIPQPSSSCLTLALGLYILLPALQAL